MKLKILLLSVAGLLILAAIAGIIWWSLRPQIITFSDDATVTLLKVDYGKHHTPPTVKVAAKSTSGRPARRPRGSTFNTTNDTLVLWVRQQYDQQDWHNFEYYLYDKNGTACVQSATTHWGNNGQRGNDLVGVEFDAFPRRGGKFYVAISENVNGGNEMAGKKFSIRNPAGGSFPAWTPELLPTTKTDDDFSVTLTKFVYGIQKPYNNSDTDNDDALNKGAQATFHYERNGRAVTNWMPVAITTVDATGNHTRSVSFTPNSWSGGWMNNEWQDGDDLFSYQYGLWPNEPAWKIQLEFSQQSDFADGELWTVQKVPLQNGRRNDFWNYNPRTFATNTPYAESDLNGAHLKLFAPKQFTDAGPNSNPQGGFTLMVSPPLPEGMRLTLVKLTDDQGYDIQHWENTWNPDGNSTVYRCQLNDVLGATNLNFTIAVHRSRFAEFTVKPVKATETDDTQN